MGKKRPRCPDCSHYYIGHRKGKYHTVLVSVYRKKGNWYNKDGQKWEKVGLYCPECKKFYPPE